MFWCAIFILVGVNVAPFFMANSIFNLHIWLAQGAWTQTLVMTMFTLTFWQKPIRDIRNIPLGVLHFWVGLTVAFICFKSQMGGRYNITTFLPYFNLLCGLIFYKCLTEYLTKEQFLKIVEILRYTVIATLIFSTMQVFTVFPFYKFLAATQWHRNNPVFGFIGNGTHLSGFLAMCISLFLIKVKRENVLAVILTFLLMCFTGTNRNDPAISGFIIALAVLTFFYKKNWQLLSTTYFLIFIGLIVFSSYFPKDFFTDSGRFVAWKYWWNVFINTSPLWGIGLGSIGLIAPKTPYPQLFHMHLEYFHYAIEIGIIGVFLIINVIVDFLNKTAESREQLALKSVVFGFLVSCLFTYPSHLWLVSFWAIFFYSAYMVINREESYGD